MDPQLFLKELNKYPLVRSRTWKRQWTPVDESTTTLTPASQEEKITASNININNSTTKTDTKTESNNTINTTSTIKPTTQIITETKVNTGVSNIGSSDFWTVIRTRLYHSLSETNSTSPSKMSEEQIKQQTDQIMKQLRENYEKMLSTLSLDDIELFAYQVLNSSPSST